MLRGAQLAAARLNAAGGVLGRQVKIVAVDDQADPTKGASVAQQAVSSGIAAVVGPFNSAVGVTALPVYQAAGVSILRMTSATDTEGFGVTTQPMVTQIAPVEARELTQLLGVHSVAVLYDPSTYTAGIASQLSALLKKDGVTVPVDQSLPPTASTSQIQSALGKVAAHSPDVTYLAMYGPEAGAVAKQMYATHSGPGAAGRCFVDLAAQGPSFVQAAGVLAANSCLASGVPAADQLPGGTAYSAAYEAKFHQTPGTWGAFVYDSVGIWAAAAAKSHQDYGSSIRSALSHTSGFNGVTGVTTVQPSTGNRENPPVVILQISLTGKYSVDPAWAAATGYHSSGIG
jgi:ABC-type branched-subunit amino acid transport system substrate-binding protein